MLTATTLIVSLALAAPQGGTSPATVALAQGYIQKYEGKLEFQNRQVVKDVEGLLQRAKTAGPKRFSETVDDLVTQLTPIAGKMVSPSTMLVVSSKVAIASPNQRTFNLFASVLNAIGKAPESIVPLEAALTLPAQFPKDDYTLDLNLAVAYIDAKQLPKGKKILDRVLKKDPQNRRAWRTYAAYWYAKGDGARVYECLLKGSQFKGFVKRKIEKKLLDVIDNDVQPNEPVETIERKIDNLDKVLPVTSAEVIEEIEPAIARQIREKRLVLQAEEKAKLPELPTKYINTTSLKAFTEQSPALTAWVEAFGEEYKTYMLSKPGAAEVANAGSEAEQAAAADALGKKEMQKALQEAKAQIERMKGMGIPGGNNGALETALKEIQKQAQKQGVTLKAQDPKTPNGLPPGFDYGSRIARINYATYATIRQAYETWLFRYFMQELPQKELEIVTPYTQRLTPILEEFNRRQQAHEKTDAHKMESIPVPNKEPVYDCRECIRRRMAHRKQTNDLAEGYWKQWSNIYFPAYAQKMKPKLEGYWRTSMLYVRNMKQKDVMQREYERVQDTFYRYAMQVASGMGKGMMFMYTPITPDEEELFEATKQEHETIAETEVAPKTLQQFDVPKDDWVKWIGDNLYFEAGLSVPLLAHLKLKITPTTVEIEPYAVGMLASIKLDMLNGKLDTTWGPAVKLWFPGIRMLGLEGEAQLDAIRKQTSIGLEDGSYSESYTKPGGGVQLKNNYVTAKLKMDIEMKPKLEVKLTQKMPFEIKGMKGNATLAGSVRDAREILKLMD
jgi:hypothetical protein